MRTLVQCCLFAAVALAIVGGINSETAASPSSQQQQQRPASFHAAGSRQNFQYKEARDFQDARPRHNADMEEADEGAYVQAGGAAADTAEQTPRMVKKEYDVIVTVHNISAFRTQAVALVDEYKGYTQDSRLFNGNAKFVFRVPVAHSAEFVSALLGFAAVVDVFNEKGEDVTQQYVDAASRAKTLEATHDQLVELMKRANTVSDVLQVQRELTQITERLEAYKSTVNYLKSASSLSTIRIEARPPAPPPPPVQPMFVPPTETVFTVFNSAAQIVLNLLWGVLKVLIYALVFFPVLAVPATCFYFCCQRLSRSALVERV